MYSVLVGFILADNKIDAAFKFLSYEAFLTLKVPITTAADDIHNFFQCFSKKIRIDVSSESMKNQALFSLKYESKKLKCNFEWIDEK